MIRVRQLVCGFGLVLLCACGAAATRPDPPTPIADDVAAFCEEFRADAQEVAQENTNDEPSDAPARGWPLALPGMTQLATEPAPPALTRAMLGPPCRDGDNLWAVRVTQLGGHLADVEQDIVAVLAPSIVRLSDGRAAFFATASEGQYHAADGFGLIAFLDMDDPARTSLFAMPGGGTWGETGAFNVPLNRPAGVSQIWSAAGDISFGDAQGWAGVTDVSGETPRALGRFLTYGRRSCGLDPIAASAQCRGGWEYIVTSIAFAPSGDVTLQWRMQEFDETRMGADAAIERSNVRTRDLSATYAIGDNGYRRQSGEEPPRLE